MRRQGVLPISSDMKGQKWMGSLVSLSFIVFSLKVELSGHEVDGEAEGSCEPLHQREGILGSSEGVPEVGLAISGVSDHEDIWGCSTFEEFDGFPYGAPSLLWMLIRFFHPSLLFSFSSILGGVEIPVV